MFKVNNKDTRVTPMASFWCLYCEFLTYFTSCSSVSIVNLEHVNADWVAAEMFKVYSNLALLIFTEIFNKLNPNYQLRHTSHYSVPPVKTVHKGIKSLFFLGPKIWDIVPTELQ